MKKQIISIAMMAALATGSAAGLTACGSAEPAEPTEQPQVSSTAEDTSSADQGEDLHKTYLTDPEPVENGKWKDTNTAVAIFIKSYLIDDDWDGTEANFKTLDDGSVYFEYGDASIVVHDDDIMITGDQGSEDTTKAFLAAARNSYGNDWYELNGVKTLEKLLSTENGNFIESDYFNSQLEVDGFKLSYTEDLESERTKFVISIN